MSNVFIGLLVAAGVAAWVYGKIMRQSGNNTQSAVTVAGTAGFFGFITMLLLLNYIDNLFI